MYKVVLPILGFESFSKIDVEKLDEFVSFLKFEDGSKISIININVLNKVSFDFKIDDKALEALKIKSKDDFSTYFMSCNKESYNFPVFACYWYTLY